MNDEEFAENFKTVMSELGVRQVDEEGVGLFRLWYNIYHFFWLIKRFFVIFSYVAIFIIVLRTDIIPNASVPFKLAFLSGLFLIYGQIFSVMPYLEGQKIVALAVRLINMYPEHYIRKEEAQDGRDS